LGRTRLQSEHVPDLAAEVLVGPIDHGELDVDVRVLDPVLAGGLRVADLRLVDANGVRRFGHRSVLFHVTDASATTRNCYHCTVSLDPWSFCTVERTTRGCPSGRAQPTRSYPPS